jgi:CDP-diacylglycerol--glycerol-3-phosphate 3-phosphatidyltransferase
VTKAVPDPAALPPQGAPVLNVANGLTMFRLLLVPVVAVTLLHQDGRATGWRIAACAVFALASVTDRMDGDLARRKGLITEFGKLADPLADKALTGTALVGLSSLQLLPWWVTVVILVREVGVTLLRFWVIRHGVIPASRGGKLKTLVQSVAIGLYLLPLSGVLASLAAWTMGLALVLTVGTGIDYVVRAFTLRRTSARARMRRVAAGGPARGSAGGPARGSGGGPARGSGGGSSGGSGGGPARGSGGGSSGGSGGGSSGGSGGGSSGGSAGTPAGRSDAGSSDDRPVARP